MLLGYRGSKKVCPDFLPFLFFLVGTFTVILSVIYRKEKV
jgi:hypothetical protein